MTYKVLNADIKHGAQGEILTNSYYYLSIKSGSQHAIINCDYSAYYCIDTFINNYIDILPLLSLAINSGGCIENIVIANI